MLSLKKTIMQKFNYTEEEAEASIMEAREILQEYLDEGDLESAEYICEEMWGLEPDYMMEFV